MVQMASCPPQLWNFPNPPGVSGENQHGFQRGSDPCTVRHAKRPGSLLHQHQGTLGDSEAPHSCALIVSSIVVYLNSSVTASTQLALTQATQGRKCFSSPGNLLARVRQRGQSRSQPTVPPSSGQPFLSLHWFRQVCRSPQLALLPVLHAPVSVHRTQVSSSWGPSSHTSEASC